MESALRVSKVMTYAFNSLCFYVSNLSRELFSRAGLYSFYASYPEVQSHCSMPTDLVLADFKTDPFVSSNIDQDLIFFVKQFNATSLSRKVTLAKSFRGPSRSRWPNFGLFVELGTDFQFHLEISIDVNCFLAVVLRL